MSGTSWELLAEGKALWTASSGAGTTIEAGLPNVEGGINFYTLYRYDISTLGTFGVDDFQESDYAGANKDTRMSARVTFKASNSNSIYGNSSTVQPPAIKVYAYKRVS